MPEQPEGFSEDLAKAVAVNANGLDTARKSVDDAAAVSAGIWLSYLFTLFYIGIAAGAVTHKDLLLENPVKLPFLNVELPLIAFFALAPVLFIISHTYALIHFVLLAAKVNDFNIELEKKFPLPKTELAEETSRAAELQEARLGQRRRLPSNIFVQLLAGPRDVRDGGLGRLLKAVAWVSLVIGPVLLLLVLQIQFLPYHLAWVTWVQRFTVLIDVSLLWVLWPAVLNGRSDIDWPRLWRHPVLTLASLVPIGVAFMAATFPGEVMDELIGKKQWIPPNRLTAGLGQTDAQGQPIWTSFHDLLFNGVVDPVARRRTSLFSNTLVLPGVDLPECATLRGRHLEGAVFDGVNLRRVDLKGTQLQGASLRFAQLEGPSAEADKRGSTCTANASKSDRSAVTGR
jgi:Pentapeptide repeats (8 copies)